MKVRRGMGCGGKRWDALSASRVGGSAFADAFRDSRKDM